MSLSKMLPMLLFFTLGIIVKNSSYCMTDCNSFFTQTLTINKYVVIHVANIGKNFKLKKETVENIICSPNTPDSSLTQYEGNIIVISSHHLLVLS